MLSLFARTVAASAAATASTTATTAIPRHSVNVTAVAFAAAAAAASTVSFRSLSSSNRCNGANDRNATSLVVQKYGGTSLGTAEKLYKVMDIVHEWHGRGSLAMVVSALSSHTKSEGTTSRLLAAAEGAINQREFIPYLEAIADTHMDVVRTMFTEGGENRSEVEAHIENELTIVRRFCNSLGTIRELSPRSHDMIVGAGERLSAGLIAGVLRENGIPAVKVDLSNVYDGLDASRMGYHRDAVKQIRSHMLSLNNGPDTVPVVTGYMGDFAGGIVDAVGRGYSDLTGALVAAALEANALQVWKESDGIFSGNPTKIDNARLVHYVSPQEAAELTYFGNEVLHPFTMECAIEANIPIHILNTFTPSSRGTVVDPVPNREEEAKRGPYGAVAVVSKKNIQVVNLTSNRKVGSTTFSARVFDICAAHDVKIDLITTSEANLSMSINEAIPTSKIDELVHDLQTLGTVRVDEGRAVLNLVGKGMKHNRGVAAKMFTLLADAGVNLEMICQGASELTVAVVIDGEQVDTAIKAVHDAMLLE